MTKPEIETTWALVVESDEIYSEKTRKWYEVRGVVRIKGTSMVRVFAKGIPKAFNREAGDPVKVRRGPTGQAADVFTIIFSGQTARDIPESEAS